MAVIAVVLAGVKMVISGGEDDAASAKKAICMRSAGSSCRRRSAYRFVRYFGEIQRYRE